MRISSSPFLTVIAVTAILGILWLLMLKPADPLGGTAPGAPPSALGQYQAAVNAADRAVSISLRPGT